eukprot:6194818-Pleurochrysis_carterae.AAC.2
MRYKSLEAVAHALPADLYFAAFGVWKCCDLKGAWRSSEEFEAEQSCVADLTSRAVGEDEDAQKEENARLACEVAHVCDLSSDRANRNRHVHGGSHALSSLI